MSAGLLLVFAGVALPQGSTVLPEVQSVEIAGSGSVVELLAGSGTVVYARTAEGKAFRSGNGGRDWRALPVPERATMRWGSMAAGAESFYLEGVSGEGTGLHGVVLRSGDGGQSFQQTPIPLQLPTGDADGALGPRLAIDPNQPRKLLLATPLNGLWQSRDGGTGWTRVRSFPAVPLNGVGLSFVAWDPASGKSGQDSPTVLAGVADPFLNLLRSDDGGQSWKPVRGGPAGVFPNHAAMSAEGVLYLSYGDTPGGIQAPMTRGGIWSYVPRTRQWRNLTPEAAHASGFSAIALDGRQPGTLYAAVAGGRGSVSSGVFVSEDGGAHWKTLSTVPGKPIRGVTALLAGPTRLLYGVEP